MEEKEVMKIYNAVLKDIIYPILGKKTTWGDDLTRMGHKLFGKTYAGTFSSDKIPDLGFIKKGIFKIPITVNNIKSNSKLYTCINLDNSNQPGSHWVALAYDVYTSKIMIYDSFGRDTKKILPSLIEKFGDANIVMSDQDPEQDPKQDDCGARCMAFLYIFDRFGSKKAKLV